MSQHIFQLESELQNIPEAAPKASPSFSVSEKLCSEPYRCGMQMASLPVTGSLGPSLPGWRSYFLAIDAHLRSSNRLISPLHTPDTNTKPMELQTLKDLYIHELKDLYSAEQQLIKALPKIAKAAGHKELVAGFQEHLEQTKGHAQRLEQILSSHKQTTRGAKCKGMEGIVAEGAEMIEEEADGEVKDAGLIAAAQRVEHYEMAGYGTARTYAELLGDQEGAKLLALTLEEEKETDQKLTKLAKSAINVAAAK
jgi:ferritin-like metal-binding protein YciE